MYSPPTWLPLLTWRAPPGWMELLWLSLPHLDYPQLHSQTDGFAGGGGDVKGHGGCRGHTNFISINERISLDS